MFRLRVTIWALALVALVFAGETATFSPLLERFLRGLEQSFGLTPPDLSPMPDVPLVDELRSQGYRYEAGLFHHSLYDDSQGKHVVIPYGDRIINWNVAEKYTSLASTMERTTGLDAPPKFGFWDFIPRQLAVIPSNKSLVTFTSPCYRQYTAQFTRIDESGADLVVTVNQTDPLKDCSFEKELLSFSSSLGYPKVHEVALESGPGRVGQFQVTMVSWAKDELEYIQRDGLFCSVWPLGAVGTVLSILDTVELFVSTDDDVLAKLNAEFMAERVNWTMRERSTGVVQPDQSDLRNGDMFAILRLDGLDPMIGWGTGGHTGHTAMAIEMDGKMHVVESTAANPFGHVYWPPPYGVIVTPYDQWMQQAVKANYMVDLCRLDNDKMKAFNAPAAIEFFNQVQGSPYGFHNFIFSFIDTISNNLPWPTSPALFHGLMNIADRLSGGKSSNMSIYTLMTAGLNHRLGTNCERMDCINQALLAKGMMFAGAATIPEQDSWLYDGKRSMVCDVFVLEMYKAAGIIDPKLEIQATEQTPKDLYQMKIWQSGSDWLPKACKSASDFNSSLPYCQLMGNYYLDLNEFNTIDLYPKMNEQCASNPYYNYSRCEPPQVTTCKC